MSEPWYHPWLSRTEAERSLIQFNRDGAFLIRDSERIANAMVLSLLFRGGVYHYRIRRKENNKLSLLSVQQGDIYFNTLDEIVHNFKHPRGGLECPLSYPCPIDTDEPSVSLAGKRVKVIYDYEAVNEDQLSIKAGEIIEVTSGEEGGWLTVKYHGRTGLFPSTYVKLIKEGKPTPLQPPKEETKVPVLVSLAGKRVKVIYDYEAVNEDQLSIKAGEIIEVTSGKEGGWLTVKYHGRTGLFPSTYVKLVKEGKPTPLQPPKEETKEPVLDNEMATTEDLTKSLHDWTLERNDIVLSSIVVGEGAWGKVLEGTYAGCKVAVKEIHELILSPYNRRLFEREMTVASKCRHPCLLQFIGATNDDQSPLFVTELMETSLRAVLQERVLKPKEITTIALDVAKGLNYLHLKRPAPIIHRDISSANILLWRNDADWRAKISDYGSADFFRDSMTVCPGAFIYSAPEAKTPRQSPKVDVYSFGVLLCEMSIRELPDVKNRNGQVSRVTNDFFRQLIRKCLRQDPNKRPCMAEIIEEITKPGQRLVGKQLLNTIDVNHEFDTLEGYDNILCMHILE